LATTAVLAVLAALVALALAPVIAANGHGVTVYLGYLPEVSNWGPYGATGKAYVNAGEGRAHITVAHMICDPTLRYEVWLAPADDRNALSSIGTFEVDSMGSADVELVSPGLKPAEYRFLVITAEPVADDDPQPSARRTVAGVFPNAMARTPAGETVGFEAWTQSAEAVGEPAVEGSPRGAAPPSPTANGLDDATPERAAEDSTPAAPPRLPVTGGEAWMPLVVAFTAVAGVASIGLVVAGGRRKRAAARAIRDASRGEPQ